MRLTLIILALMSFTVMAVFGIAFMGDSQHHRGGFNACVGSLTKGAVCPENNPVEAAVFHLDAFKAFSNSTLFETGATVSLAVLAVALAVLAAQTIPPLESLPAQITLAAFGRIFETAFQPFKAEKIFWSALHENSPANAAASGYGLSF